MLLNLNPVKASAALLMLGIMLSVNGCSSTSNRGSSAANTVKSRTLFPVAIKQTKTQKRLTKHFRSWEQTPYKFGGSSKQGVDCSGFIHVTFRDVFTSKVPRTTELLAKTGKNIAKNNLKFGDLVFFKTGRRQRHAGIYIGNGKFIHASSSRGVMQSEIDSPYWRKHYWKSKRILNL